ncbi:hydantoinase/oxoprolinase family protein [Agrobacterium vitis]|uniref:hydantoinase/oxoprolinase family protein n=1 Tax=Allorhizobium ampelinum TaxID=3025782 RepID=UPI001F310968|nr:hydantoinase/oxoprolinase family protein [Allorhizobium ampelinum]MCF1464826.1 hydantoinase/oxoprolinase family protein [Allorhizobium ampelinum]
MATRIGVDIGGTFTDLVYFDEENGRTVEGKVPTVPSAPEEGVAHAIRAHVPQDIIDSAAYFLHGTTVGLNALLERRGAKVGLITTQGFRDVLEIRRGDRAEMYNLFWKQTVPLVPRRLRLEVDGRVRGDGAVLSPVTRESVLAAYELLAAEKVDSIAVCLISAFANPQHELEIEAIIRDAGYEGGISLSHKISGEYREYERTSTTVIDAFVRGRMSNYLRRLENTLRNLGFKGQCLITRSGSGSMTFSEAEDRPFETIMSGPVGGAQGAGELAKMLGRKAMITADVGGTSFDTAVIIDGEPQVLFEGMIDNMPVQTPWVDVRSIGSGGGSLAYVDVGNLMRVGPQSAGAVPGPACYGKGGIQPALTDAAAYLGMLGPGNLASGIHLDIGKAEAALAPVASAIGQDIEMTAAGVLRIASSAMANAMREISLDQGFDPREMTLLPFGGAGPLMATLLADELKMNEIVVPPLAGNFSAWGLLGADMVQSAARTRILDLTDDSLKIANEVLEGLFVAIRSRSERSFAEAVNAVRLDLRYKGQEHRLSIVADNENGRISEGAESIKTKFRAEYSRTFGSTMNDEIEVVSIRATVRVPLPRREIRFTHEPEAVAEFQMLEAFSFEKGKRMSFAIVQRQAIVGKLSGPAIITEGTCTTYLDADWTARIGTVGEIILERKN